MPNWFKRLTKRGDGVPVATPAVAAGSAAEPAPEFSTRLAVDSPGAPGRAGAEALYQKWAAKWQEF